MDPQAGSLKADPLGPHRQRLFGLAYRMLGSRSEAEDVLQDAWLRFNGAREVRDDGAYLAQIVTRLCLDRMRSAAAKRETYVGPWLPEPLIDQEASPDAAIELADDISFALLLALERLTPLERAAFLLHDVFDTSFEDVAAALGKSEAACRQLASRARKSVRSERRSAPVSADVHSKLFESFLNAVSIGDVEGLQAVLREDVVMISDGGGVKLAALNPVRGRDKVIRFFIKTGAKYIGPDHQIAARMAMINGRPGLLLFINGEVDQVQSIDVDGDRISAIYIVRNPEKLAGFP